jgi:hypothetical protein
MLLLLLALQVQVALKPSHLSLQLLQLCCNTCCDAA